MTACGASPFWSPDADLGKLITGATILCFSFTGFDSLSSLAEETKDTKKTLPRAIFLTALISGLIFVFATYFMQLYFPGDPTRYFQLVDETQPEILLLVGGAFFQSVVLSFAIVTVMASGISAHAGVSRLMYVMGRDGVLPKKFFGHIHPRSHPVLQHLAGGRDLPDRGLPESGVRRGADQLRRAHRLQLCESVGDLQLRFP
jgi:amino acid transporter